MSAIFDRIASTQLVPIPQPKPFGNSVGGTAPSASSVFGSAAFAQPAATSGGIFAPLEKMNVTAPFSTMNPDQAKAYKPPVFQPNRNIFQAFGDTWGSMFSGQEINLANVVPFLMERPFVAAQSMADWATTDVLHAPKETVKLVHDVLGAPVEAVKFGSDVLAQPLNFIRDTSIDWANNVKGGIARGVADGSIHPYLAQAALLGAGPLGMGDFINGMVQAVANLGNPEYQTDEGLRRFFLRTLDLPPGAIDALIADPKADAAGVISGIGGRRWGYAEDATGIAHNLIGDGGLMIAAILATKNVGAALGPIATNLGAGSAVRVVGGGVSLLSKTMRASLIAGTGTYLATSGLRALAETAGNQAAYDWATTMLNDRPMSNDPNVQLVLAMGFSGLEGLSLLRRGSMQLANMPMQAFIGANLGRKYAGMIESVTNERGLAVDRLMKMLHDDPAVARPALERNWSRATPDAAGNMLRGELDPGAVVSTVTEIASDIVIKRLPMREKAVLSAIRDPAVRSQVFLERHADEVWNVIKDEPDAMTRYWREDAFNYHFRDTNLSYDPEIAGAMQSAYQMFKVATYDIRAKYDAVVGMTEHLPPERADAYLDAIRQGYHNADDLVDPQLLRRWLIETPGLRNDMASVFRSAKSRSGSPMTLDRWTRSDVELALDQSKLRYAEATKTINARITGPLRPWLPENAPAQAVAEALGIDAATYAAVMRKAPEVGDAERVAKYLTDNGETRTLAPEEALARAQEITTKTLEPLYALGRQVGENRALLARKTQELADAETAGNKARASALRGEITDLYKLGNEAFTGGGIPYSARAVGAKVEQRLGTMLRNVVKRDAGRVEAQYRLGRIGTINDGIRSIVTEHPWLGPRQADWFAAQEGWKALQKGDADALATFHRQFPDAAVPASALDLYRLGGDPLVPEMSGLFASAPSRGPLPGSPEWDLMAQEKVAGRLNAKDAAWVEYVDAHPGLTEHDLDVTQGLHDALLEKEAELTAGGDPTEWNRLVRAADRAPATVGPKLRSEAASVLGRDSELGQRLLDPKTPNDEALAIVRAAGIHRGYELPAEVAAAGDFYATDPVFRVVEHPANVKSMQDAIDLYVSTDAAVADDAASRIARAITSDRILARRFADAIGAKRAEDPAKWGNAQPFGPDGPNIWMLDSAELHDVANVNTNPVVGDLDEVLRTGDAEAISAKLDEIANRPPPPPEPFSTSVAQANEIVAERVRPRSLDYAREINAVGGHMQMSANQALLEGLEKTDKAGLDNVSTLIFGAPGIRPTTIEGYAVALREIENGNATRRGMGEVNQMLAQRAAQKVLDRGVIDAKRAGFEVGVITRGMDPGHMALEDWITAKDLVARDLFSWTTEGNLAYGLKKRPQNRWLKLPEEMQGLATADLTAAPAIMSATQEAARTVLRGLGEKAAHGRLTPEEQQAYGASLVDRMSLEEHVRAGATASDVKAIEHVTTNGVSRDVSLASGPSTPYQALDGYVQATRLSVGTTKRGNPLRVRRMADARKMFDDSLRVVRGKPRTIVEAEDGSLYELRQITLADAGHVPAASDEALRASGKNGMSYPRVVRGVGDEIIVEANPELLQAARRMHPTGNPAVPAWVRIEETVADLGGGERTVPTTLEMLRNGRTISGELKASAKAAGEAATPGTPGWEDAIIAQQARSHEGQVLQRAGAVSLEFEPLRAISGADHTGRGLAEEWLAGKYEDWAQRVSHVETRSAFNIVFGRPKIRSAYTTQTPLEYLFGPMENSRVGTFVHDQFIRILAEQGVGTLEGEAVWTAWHEAARMSADATEVGGSFIRKTIANKERIQVARGDKPRWATVRNIPNADLEEIAQQAARDVIERRKLGGSFAGETVRYALAFRTAASPILRHIHDNPQTGPLGETIAHVWGFVSSNKAVTTMYPLFRFALDIRFWAMEWVEPYLLYAGKAGLMGAPKYGEKGLLDINRSYLSRLDNDGVRFDTVYQGGGPRRFGQAYKVFLKQRAEYMDAALAQTESNATIMERALKEVARDDPALSDAIGRFDGGSTDAWLTALDRFHAKVLDATDPMTAIDGELEGFIAQYPGLSQIAQTVGDANKRAWMDVRELFYGKADRSRVERILNSPLLYWPISYQLRAGKAFADILFTRAGGLQTGATGGLLLDRMMAIHNDAMANNPAYRKQLAENKTLLFAASMMLPMTWDQQGVSLSPLLRNLAFDRSKNVGVIGPIYTITSLVPNMATEVWRDMSSLPLMQQGSPIAEPTSRALEAISGRTLRPVAPTP